MGPNSSVLLMTTCWAPSAHARMPSPAWARGERGAEVNSACAESGRPRGLRASVLAPRPEWPLPSASLRGAS
eukprot:1006904-Lingulodinium_polyedra.AAC.1